MADGLDVSEMMKRAVQANAKFYKGWMDLSLEYIRGISEIIGGPIAESEPEPTPETDAGTGALILEGEAGVMARGSFLVTNDLERTVSCAFVSSDFRDHANSVAKAAPTFDPPAVQLGAGEQRVIQVSMMVNDTLAPGVGYAGEFSIKGMDGFAVPVVLRRQHSAGEARQPDTPPGKPRPGTEPKTATAQGATRSVRKRSAAKRGSGTRTNG